MVIYPLSKKVFEKTKQIIQKNDSFVFWILLVLSVDYLALFFVESVLPGYVMNHLNLNFLLLLILSGWLIFSLLSSKRKLVRNQKKVLKIFGISFLAIFFISAWFILYKLAFWELITTFLFLIVIGFLLYKN